MSPDTKSVQIESDLPVKGLVLECDDDEARFDDNCVDVVPGEKIVIGVGGLKKEDALTVRYLDMEV